MHKMCPNNVRMLIQHRDLLSNVECPTASFLVSPITAKHFTKYWVIWLFETLQKHK